MAKKLFDWKTFEKVTTYLLDAEHDVEIECPYISGSKSRQFDGYYELKQESPLSSLKIGIECKNYGSAVQISIVEAFTTKIRQCRLDKGIMVSFSGFQEGAINHAKDANIDLLEFRVSKEEDLVDENNIRIFTAIDVKLEQITPHYDILNTRIKIVNEENINIDGLRLKLHKGQTDHLYNENNEYIGSFNEFIEHITKQHRKTMNIEEENIINVDWEDKNLFLRQRHNGQNLLIKMLSFDIKITFTKESTSMRVGSSNPQDWFVMKNVVIENSVLIPRLKVEQIMKKFNLEYKKTPI